MGLEFPSLAPGPPLAPPQGVTVKDILWRATDVDAGAANTSSTEGSGKAVSAVTVNYSSSERDRQIKLGLLAVQMGAAGEKEVFGKDGLQRKLTDLLVINRKEDDASNHPMRWYNPISWFLSGAQVSPIVYKRVVEVPAAAKLAGEQTSGHSGGSGVSVAVGPDAEDPLVKTTATVGGARANRFTAAESRAAEGPGSAPQPPAVEARAASPGNTQADVVRGVYDDMEAQRKAEREAAAAVAVALVGIGGAKPVRDYLDLKPRRSRTHSSSGKNSIGDDDVSGTGSTSATAGDAAAKKKKPLTLPLRNLTKAEVAALEETVARDRRKILGAEKQIHDMLYDIANTRYRYLTLSSELRCEAEVIDVIKCYHSVKLVERFKNRQSAAVAQRSSSRFTDHQSSNARRREEEQMRTVTAFGSTSRQFSGGSLTTTDAGNPLELTFQSRRPAPVTEEKQAFLSSAECRQRQQRMQDFSRPGGRPSSFERQAKPWGHSSPVPRAAVSSGAVSGTRARARERFSLRDNEAPLHGAENGRGEFTLLGKRTHDGPASLGTGTTIGGAGLLGHYAPRPSATTGYASSAAHPGPNVQGENDDEGVEPEAKKSRLERFQEIVSNSKSRRAELQQQRLERERATNTLDAEFKEIFHLLPRRDRIREDREAFEATGTPEMRAYLAAFKKGHAARILRVKSNGEATVALLAGGPEKTVTLEGKSRPQRAATHNGGATAVSSHGLDEQDKALLRRIYSGEGKEDAVGEASDSAVVASPSGVTVPAPIPGRRGAGGSARSAFEAVGGGDEDDEFDQLMNVIRLETRKAHAVERTATEEEEAARAAQDAMLEADRGAVPRLGLEEEEQVQRTRGEWLQQGGDRVFRMGDEDEAAEEDNVVLPEFTESDESDAGEAAGSGADDDAETDGRAERAPLNKLDAALEQLEQLARGRVEATPHVGGGRAQVERCEAFQAILVTLHSYGKRHAVHLAQTFRLILVEAEREFLKSRRAPSKLMLTYLYTMTKLFPMSDFRHEVSTPLVIFLCSCLMQMRLLTRRDVHVYVMLTGMLSEALLPSGPKFAAEIIVAIMNVLCLQLPECVLEPLKYHGLTVSFPVVERVTEALLGDSFIGASVGGPAVCSPAAKTPQGFLQASRAVWAPLSLTGDAATVDARGDSARLLLSVYRILDAVATSWRRMAGFTYAVAAPFEEVDGLLRGSLDHAWLQEHAADFAFFTTSPHGTPAARSSAPPAAQGTWRPHPDVLRAHLLMMERIRQYEGGVIAKRTPLAMRTTRVRPLRLFDPMLEEAFDTDKAEERMLKKTLREDKKRAVRHVQSDAMVDRRLREKEESQTRDLRLQKYNELLGELQRQQHVMKTVDMLKTKARSKKHKSISGAPSAGDAGVGEDGPSSHGGE